MKFRLLGALSIAAIAHAPIAGAQLFTDNFNAGASILWGNQRGAWYAAGGIYNAAAATNSPPTLSLLPFALTDYSFDVDIQYVRDGGIWLRAAYDPITNIMTDGVLLITGGGAANGRVYWHNLVAGVYSAEQNYSLELFGLDAANTHVRVEVVGDIYTAYINGSTTAATSFTTSDHASGLTGLYDNSGQTFDNVEVDEITGTPEPASLLLVGTGLLGMAGIARRRRMRVRAA